MKNLKLTILAALLLSVFSAATFAQVPTTAKTFRMYNDATHNISITAGTAAGTTTYTWPQVPNTLTTGSIFKLIDNTGTMAIGQVGLNTTDITGTLNITNGGTGITTVGPTNSVAYSNGTTFAFTAAPPAAVNSILVSLNGGAPSYATTLPSSVLVPFQNITSGTNNIAAMLVGAGATLFPTSTGQIGANVFVGTGSTTNAVDLNTAEVNGILPVGNGGTGVSTAGAVGSIFYSSGPLATNPLSSTGAGTTGQVLGNVGGTPTWQTPATPPGTAIAKGRTQGTGASQYVITPGGGYTATSVVAITLESGISQTYTITSRSATTFTVDAANNLGATEFIDWIVY